MTEQNKEQEKPKNKPKLSSAEKRKRRKRKKTILLIFVLILAGMGGYLFFRRHQQTAQLSAGASEQRTARVEKRDITSELSSSGTLAPKDTYSITSLVEGEVIFAEFEEGDQVEKGQILYQIDATSMQSEIQSANNSLSRAQKSYSESVKDYNEIAGELSGNTYKATKSGYVKSLYIEAGSKIGANAQICDIYDDLTMEIRLPFLSGEAQFIEPGMEAYLTLTDTGEAVSGIVTSVSSLDEVLAGGTLVRYVSMDVANPGGLTAQTSATAMVGGLLCAEEGYFQAKINTVMAADLESSVEVETVLINEGDYITEGMPIFQITAKSVEKILKTYEDSIDRAKESVETAQNKVDSTKDSYENYTITAPISGQVITKTTKLGDNISRSGNSNTTMAVIYDLSSLTFEMSIDELDIQKVKVGQKVVVTADAFEGETFYGTVTNVSLQSTAANGVTNYPVTVTMDETGDLLPGMNVDGVIVLEEVKDVLSIPVDSLLRGNRVYVKEESASGSNNDSESNSADRNDVKPEGADSQHSEGTDSQQSEKTGGQQHSQDPDNSGNLTQPGNQRNSSSPAQPNGQGNAPAGFYAVEVETGLISDEYVEIISGLEEGQEVYVDESSQNSYNSFMMPGGMGGPGGGMGGGPSGPGGGSGGGRPGGMR